MKSLFRLSILPFPLVALLWIGCGPKPVVQSGQRAVEPKPKTVSKPDGVTRKYDEKGNVIEVAHFDADGQPILNRPRGYSKRTTKYDAKGNAVEVAYFGVDGQPIVARRGLAKKTMKYDANGKLIEESHFGVDGMPTLSDRGFAKQSRKYDAKGHLVEHAYFGLDGKPALSKYSGHSKETLTYNQKGQPVEHAYFGLDGEPVMTKGGHARITKKYNARGRHVHSVTFDAQNNPLQSMTKVYDAQDRLIKIQFPIEEAVIDGLLKKPEDIYSQIRVVAKRQAGKIVGYRISGIRRSFTFYKLGLRNGDVIHSVNGRPIADLHKVIIEYNAKQSPPAFNFEITRRAKKITLEYEIR